jgi:hypothetical protein
MQRHGSQVESNHIRRKGGESDGHEGEEKSIEEEASV